ncbi:MAG: hypothetical protein KAJ19_12370 [Gammaproteobacteria bacterium]|nr:hypothetical protein [Gammaproteobacteria bacterium]
MNDNDYIKAAVELADGFEWHDGEPGGIYWPKVPLEANESGLYIWSSLEYQPVLDALAAQLVRQVDAIRGSGVIVGPYKSGIYFEGGTKHEFDSGEDRTMNTIKAIVDSKILT